MDILDQLFDEAKAALGNISGRVAGGGGDDGGTQWEINVGERPGIPWVWAVVALLVLVFFLASRRGA